VFDSVVDVDTTAKLVTVPGLPVGFTTRVTVALAPWANVPRRQVTSKWDGPPCGSPEPPELGEPGTVHPGVPDPIPGVELRRLKPGGRWSTTVTLAAEPSPELVTVMV
jgi:hypothetical protein